MRKTWGGMSRIEVQAIILLLGSSFLYTRAETVSLSLDNGAGILDLLNNGITELDSMFPHEKKGGCSPKFKGETDADDDTGRCFKISVCYISGWSLKKCCPEGTVYTPPTASKPLGSCDPPVVVTCPVIVGATPVCGDAGSDLTITVDGDGTCSTLFTAKTGATPVSGSCTANLFNGATCGAYPGHLLLRAVNKVNAPVGKYVPPDFQTPLTKLGLGSIKEIGIVELVVDSKNIPVPIAPTYLPGLVKAKKYAVIGQTQSPLWRRGAGSASTMRPLFKRGRAAPIPTTGLVGVPGAANLKQVDELVVAYTSLTNLTSFSNCRCLLNVNIVHNAFLSSTAGLENVSGSYLNSLVITDNPYLNSPTALAGISNLLGCTNGTSTSTATVNIDAGCLTNLVTPSAVCSYIFDGTCPSAPSPSPPPPVSTPSPPVPAPRPPVPAPRPPIPAPRPPVPVPPMAVAAGIRSRIPIPDEVPAHTTPKKSLHIS